MTPHPSPDELTAFLAGQLDPARSRDIDAHLDGCDGCRAALPPRHPPELPDLPLPPGYDLVEEVGRGGMGIVYRARRREDGHEVAIKTLHPDFRDNPTFAAYLEREAEITARVRHLRVLSGVRLRRYSDADPTPFIEFPWVPGTTLAKMLGSALARESVPRLVRWVVQCAKAVEAAHRHDPPIVHFDLKPENLLIYDRDGEAVLIDFGLASEWPPPTGESRAGRGTPAYMAPEVANGWVPLIGPRTDVFALGGMLCAVLTGKPPYDKADFGDTDGVARAARNIDLAAALRRLDAVREHPELVAFAKRCLSSEPANRPADAGEVWRELETLVGRTRRRLPNVPRWTWAGVAAGVLAACVLLAVLFRDRAPTPDALLTAGPWARHMHFRPWSDEQTRRIETDFSRRKLPPRKFGPLHDEAGFAIVPCDVGAYPLVSFHRPDWVEAVTLSHDATLTRPLPTDSDYHHVLPPVPGALVTVPLPGVPGWEKAVNGDRLCKQPLTVAVAFTNGQYLDLLAVAGGGLSIVTTRKRYGLGTELGGETFLSGPDENARGAGSRAYVALEGVRLQWEAAKSVKLRDRPTVYEYDLHPRKLGWEKHIRDGEAD